MHADPNKVRARRWKRRLKAAGSLALAALAGAFVACQRGVQSLGEASAPTPSISPDRQADAAAEAAREVTTTTQDATAEVLDASATVVADARAPARDAGADGYVVDAKEHRKGMPVPDNLLE
jgi:hypothetical protein